MSAIISIEQHLNFLTYHIVIIKDAYIHTFCAKQISSAKKINKIMSCIYKCDFAGLTEFFKEEEGLIHFQITYSYGPNIRKNMKLKSQKEEI